MKELLEKFKALPQKTKIIAGASTLAVILIVIFIIASKNAQESWLMEAERLFSTEKRKVDKGSSTMVEENETTQRWEFTIPTEGEKKILLTYTIKITEKPGFFTALFADSPRVVSAGFKTQEEKDIYRIYSAEAEIRDAAPKKVSAELKKISNSKFFTHSPNDMVFTGTSWKGSVSFSDFLGTYKTLDFKAYYLNNELVIDIDENSLRDTY